MLRTPVLRSALFTLLLSGLIAQLAFAPALTAQAWDTFPVPDDDQRLAIARGLDGPQYDFLRSCLRDKKSISGASYWAAVVENSSRTGDPNDGEATPYVDALYQHWRQQGVGIDPQRHIMILIALENRAMAIHPGSFWADEGFNANRIQMGKFGNYMRDGNTDLAVCTLAEGIDTYLATLDTAELPPRGVNPPSSAPVSDPAPANRTPNEASPLANDTTPEELPAGCVWALFFLVVLFGLMLLGGRSKATSKDRGEMKAELERWREKINMAGQRLLELENQYPLYLQSGSQRWEGESAELDQESADAVNHLFLLYSKAFELFQDAEKLAENVKGRWSSKPYKDVLATLRETKVRFETGEAEPNRRIFLPLTRAYENTAPGLLEDLDSAYTNALEQLEVVAEVQEEAGTAADAGSRAAEAAMAAIEARGNLELPVEGLMQELEPLLARHDELRQRLPSDPVGVTDDLAEVGARLEALHQRAERGNKAIEQLRGPVHELGNRLRERVEELRRQGVELKEPGFEPTVRLDHGTAEAARAIDEIASGEERPALQRLQRLDEGLQELEAQIEAWYTAPQKLPELRAELRRDRTQIDQRIPDGRRILGDLNDTHAPAAFSRESDNLEELVALLERFDDWQNEILEAEQKRHYLAALADVEGSAELLLRGSALLDEIDTIHQRLEDAQALAEGDLDTLRRQRAEIESVFGPGVDERLRELLRRRSDESVNLFDAAQQARPHWLEVSAAAASAHQDLEELLQQAREQRELHQEARKVRDLLEQRLEYLDRQVQRERRDRSHVERAVEDVRQRVRQLDQQLDSLDSAGDEQLHAARDTFSALEWAEGVLRTELEAIQLAETELESARAAVRQLSYQHFGQGVVAHTSGPESELDRAERAASSRDWDEALAAARRAKAEAEGESRRAHSEARRREEEQRRRLRQQRMQQAAAAAAAAAAVANASRASAAPQIRIESPFGGSRGPSLSTSRSSFGGGASRGGGWTRSSSSRSWNARW